MHKSVWPSVREVKKIKLESITLDTFVKVSEINISLYDTLIIDTQGSELLVLKGAKKLLKNIKYIKSEVADFESYKGCCKLNDIDEFLTQKGFRLIYKSCFKRHEGGNYYDVLYEKF